MTAYFFVDQNGTAKKVKALNLKQALETVILEDDKNYLILHDLTPQGACFSGSGDTVYGNWEQVDWDHADLNLEEFRSKVIYSRKRFNFS
jgi:hypothetical protein